MFSERSDINRDKSDDAASASDVSAVWARVRRRLRAELGDDVFSSWFARIELMSIDNGVADLSIPTKFLKSWIQAHYADRVLARFIEEAPGVTQIGLHVRSAATRAKPNEAAPRPASGISHAASHAPAPPESRAAPSPCDDAATERFGSLWPPKLFCI